MMKEIILLTAAILLRGIVFSQTDTCKLSIGMNLSMLKYYSRDFPFVDIMKTSAYWLTQNQSNMSGWDTQVSDSIPKDNDGYPLYLPVNVAGQAEPQVVATIMARETEGKYPAGIYVVLYDGTGTFLFGDDASVVTQSPGRIEINVTPSNVGIFMKMLTSDVNDHIRNIRVLMPGTEFTYQTQSFNQAFLDKITPFSVIRFVHWLYTDYNTNHLVPDWNQRRIPTYYTQASYLTINQKFGVAMEYITQLANFTQKDIWLNIPHTADSNYITEMATFFRDSLNPNLKIYLEYSNEVWNYTFPQYSWVNTNGPSSLPNLPQKTAYFAKQAFDIWANVLGSQFASRVVRVAAGQAGNPWTGQQMMLYLDSSGADALSCDDYIYLGPAQYDSLDALGSNATVADVIRLARQRSEEGKTVFYQYTQTAQQYGLRLVFYEGGPHLNPRNSVMQPYIQALWDAQRDTAIGNLYNERLSFVRDSTIADLHCHLSLASDYEELYGGLGALESVFDTNSVKYQTLLDNIFDCDSTITEIQNSEFRIQNGVNVYPNPSSGKFTIYNLQFTIYELKIFDVMGKIVFQSKLQTTNYKLDLKDLPNGIYFLQIIPLNSGTNFIQTKKLEVIK